jgi:hypothetical protein
MDPKTEAYQAIDAYLAKNKTRLQVMDVDSIVWEVRLAVPKVTLLADNEVRATVAIWRSLNGPLYPMLMTPPPTNSESKLIEAVKAGVTTVIEGVKIKKGVGTLNITVTGVTAELKKGDLALSAGVSWGGTLGVEADAGPFHFSGELSSERWAINLSFPDDTSIPDLSKLGKVFGDGEAGLRKIIGATTSFRGLNDIARIKDAIHPYMQPVKDAVDAVQSIAKAPPKGGVSLGLSFGSPDPTPGQSGMPRGIQGQVTLTIRF